MALSTRSIRVSLEQQFAVRRTIWFLPTLDGADGEVILPDRYRFTYQTDGTIDDTADNLISLPVPSSGSFAYSCILPSADNETESASFNLEAGSEIALSALISGGGASSTTVTQYVDQNAVLYSGAQSLTAGQKTQAQANLGLPTTAGAIPFSNGTVQTSDSTSLSFDDANNTLKLLESGYNVATSGWQSTYKSALQIGNNNTPVAITTGFYGAKIDIYTSQSSGSGTQTSGIRVRANNASTGGTWTTTGVESFVKNVGSTTGASVGLIQAVEGIASITEDVATVVGGWFSPVPATGGSGSAIGTIRGVYSITGNFNQFTVTNLIGYDCTIAASDGPTTNRYGLKLSSWTGSVVTNSYGIYADTSIDTGTNKYFIYSLSASPSLLSGDLTVNGKLHVATQTPASASATGVAGQIAWDANFIYICTATNTWKRVAISTW